MDSFMLGSIVKGLISKSNDIQVKSVDLDDSDSSVTVKIIDNGKIKRFLIQIEEV